MDDRRLYATLGLREGADHEEVKAAYRRLVKKLHPDLSRNPASSDAFKRVVAAYKVLSVRRRPVSSFSRTVHTKNRPVRRPVRRTPNAPVDLEALGQIAETARSPEMRAFAVRKLGRSGKKSAYRFVRKALFDPSPIVVGSAVEAVAALGILQSAGELASVYIRSDREVRRQVLSALESLGLENDGFSSVLDLAMRDRHPELRKHAQKLSGRRKGA